ncbi:DNA helicase PcrA [Effusibacillus lacus]|uniref:ATP-dependent DNA helicase n=1 Tax=Effusibacillus lacus TaxID=1348429 RepID=A0A292YJX7_9BACL|nr:DNA helicase PcrA [Effusibacillus lacus]TCS76065.1 DNA helicase-2/ATP-dependent DNA helicase PcrA [Effusibacillus lacus]GAX91417.1 ATP-dependent DNA helicase PcrA [Effusibacillus lacus]
MQAEVLSSAKINKDAILKGLNPEQKQAVETTEGPLLILAGAGSGKTSVMTRRIAYLMGHGKVQPWNILAITFTNKAAKEMNERVEKLVGESAGDIWMSTFHSMCVKILRREAERLGYGSNFTILDSDDQIAAIKQCMLDLNYDMKKFEPNVIHWKISAAKNELLGPDEFKKMAGKSLMNTVTANIYREYQHKLNSINALDFDDLIFKTVQLFEDQPDVLASYQDKFRYIHVDEYQDTNRAQYRLVNLLAQKYRNLCVVGDSDQAIYRWRGADISNILNFERDYPEAKVIMLEQNYRSTNTILDAANAVIKNNSQRKDKNLWSAKGQGEPISLYAALDQADEAAYVVAKVQEHVGNGGQFRDCTVLYRANAQSRAVEEVFLQAAIPYKIIGGMTFYDRREIKDIMAYLKAVSNPADEISLLRIVNVPKRSIGEGTIKRLLDFAHDNGLTLLEAMGRAEEADLGAKATSDVKKFHWMMTELHWMQEGLSVTEFLQEMLKKTGYREMYETSPKEEDRNRLENIDELLTVTRAFDKRRRGTLADFLAETSLLSDTDKETGKKDNAVHMMTMHASKGLEFPVVFLIGAEETIFPHSRSMDTPEGIEEERNLCYVAITRAQEKLHITYCTERILFGQLQMNDPSRFLAELPEELVEKSGSGFQVVPRWEVGLRVRHPQWGIGVIMDMSGKDDELELEITFQSKHGTKRVKPKLTKLRVIEK